MPLLPTLVALLALTLAPGAGPSAVPHGTWPLGPTHEVVRGFDPPATPWGAGHRGVDLLGEPGQAVRSALEGTITFAGQLAGRGVVVVDHGGRRTTYEPVDPAVVVGQPVAAGAVIGHLQAAMSHCFPRSCLHWGLIRGTTYLDPLTLVGGGPVRLLPLDGARGASANDAARYATARSVRPSSAQPPARRAPLAPLAAVLRPGGGPAGTPRGAARW